MPARMTMSACAARRSVVSHGRLVRSSRLQRPASWWARCTRRRALDLHQVWGTGHPGGIATRRVRPLGALTRLGNLVQEVSVTPACADRRSRQCHRLHRRRGRARRDARIARVIGCGNQRLPARYLARSNHSSSPSPSSTSGEPSMLSRLSVKPYLHAAAGWPGSPGHCWPSFAAGAGHGSSMPWEAPAIRPRIDPGAGGLDRRGDHHHRHGPDAGAGDTSGGFPQAGADRLRAVHRVRGFELLPVVLLVLGRGGVFSCIMRGLLSSAARRS